MKSRIAAACFAIFAALTLSAGGEDPPPVIPGDKKEGSAEKMQYITYCCGNHPDKEHRDGPHCGHRDVLKALEKEHGCKNWHAQRP
jgi:hypothetical protein